MLSHSTHSHHLRHLTLVILAGVIGGCGGAGSDSATTMLLPERIGGWVRQVPSETYDRQTIFDYINGAGEVYRSYAFSEVLVARYTGEVGGEVTVELFDMGSPEDAYGVFSYARESEERGIGSGFERKGRVLCFWQDRYYVCLAAETPADAQPVLEEIARGISSQLPEGGERPSLVEMLPQEGQIPVSDRYFHTHQSLNYHYYLERENILELSAESDVVLARYQPGSTYLVIVRYAEDAQPASAQSTFEERHRPEAGKYASSGVWGRFLVVAIDAQSEADAENLVQATLARVRDFVE